MYNILYKYLFFLNSDLVFFLLLVFFGDNGGGIFGI